MCSFIGSTYGLRQRQRANWTVNSWPSFPLLLEWVCGSKSLCELARCLYIDHQVLPANVYSMFFYMVTLRVDLEAAR